MMEFGENLLFFKIHIKAPFWKTWWFFTLLGLFFVGIIYSFYKFKINQIKKEEHLKTEFAKQLATVEMKALRAQMNPHFIFNSLNSIQKYILKNESFLASQYLTKFSRLIRLILDYSNQNTISLANEIQLLELYVEMEAVRFDNQFEYEFNIDKNLNLEKIEIPTMFIQPYIENAIWHGLLHKNSIGKLTISFDKIDKNSTKITVEDNGIGRKKAMELKSKQALKNKSHGLKITQDRIDLLNQSQNLKTTSTIIDLKDYNQYPIGTKVELLIVSQKKILIMITAILIDDEKTHLKYCKCK
ncbi:MAG: histidine kinase [Flavobacterium sp.]|nr:histidine kinase [Flavobacterium sp.]